MWKKSWNFEFNREISGSTNDEEFLGQLLLGCPLRSAQLRDKKKGPTQFK
jgi:hypothetical protein